MSISGYDQWKTASPYDNDPDPVGGGWLIIQVGEIKRDKLIGFVELPSDCDGDDLYSKMQEMEWIDDPASYSIEAEENHIALIPSINEGQAIANEMSNGFMLHWIAYERYPFLWHGIPGRINEIGEYDAALDSDDMIDFIPTFDHESYDGSFPVRFGDLEYTDCFDSNEEQIAAFESTIFGLYLDQQAP